METLKKIDAALEKVQVYSCMVLFAAMIILGTIQIGGRFIFNYSTTWTEELIRFICIWMVFIGSALTVRKDGHVSIDLLISSIHDNRKKAILFVLSRLVCVVFLLLIIPSSIELIAKAKNSRAASMNLSFSWVYLSIPVGIVNMLLAYANAIPRLAKKYRKGEL